MAFFSHAIPLRQTETDAEIVGLCLGCKFLYWLVFETVFGQSSKVFFFTITFAVWLACVTTVPWGFVRELRKGGGGGGSSSPLLSSLLSFSFALVPISARSKSDIRTKQRLLRAQGYCGCSINLKKYGNLQTSFPDLQLKYGK